MIPLAPFQKFQKLAKLFATQGAHSCTRCYIIFQDFSLITGVIDNGRQQWPTLLACD
jgi:hypothetical protein